VIGFLPITLRACRPHLTAAQGPHLKAARILRACEYLAMRWLDQPIQRSIESAFIAEFLLT